MSELLEVFLAEARELVQAAADALLALERAPGDGAGPDPAAPDPAALDAAFRAIHTLKGSVGLFDLAPMGAALHAGEDLLEALRAGRRAAGRGEIDALLALVGASEAWVEAFAASGRLPEEAGPRARALAAALGAGLAPDAAPGAVPAAPDAASDSLPAWLPALLAREAGAVARAGAAGQALVALRYVPAADCFFLGDDPMATLRGVPGLAALHLAPREPWPAGGPDPFAANLVIEALSRAPEAAVRGALRLVPDQAEVAAVPAPAGPAPAPPAPPPARSLRVDAARIDALADLAGEMIVAKNALAHLVARAGLAGSGPAGSGLADPALVCALAESAAGIERLAEATHRAVTGLRQVPLGRAFSRLPRLAREVAARLGREVRLTVEGEAVEADRAVVDGLAEPLSHLLRNAIDHGIEPPEARAAAGKPRAGRIALLARREGDGVVVALSDDGRGLDPAALRAAARARGVMAPAAIDALDDAAALGLIFRAGFSTAAAVSDISGRGVGMDAVRAAVEALGGRVALSGAKGAGTTVRLLLPGGAAVTTVLVARAGGEAFGVPVAAVAETARVAAARVMPLRGAEAFVLRGRTVPLLRLADRLGLPPGARGAAARVLVTGAGAHRVGLEVEGFGGRLDVLLRPLDGLLRGMPGLLGTALLGDGRVMMVLDLPALVAPAAA